VKRAFAALLATICSAAAQDRIDLALPTDNDALFRGDGPAFYQHIERDYHGEKSTPWQGGRYGFVRNPVQTRDGVVYSRFHEGIDIRPLQRDAAGEPLDEVRAIADGAVVYANTNLGWSNYGNYIVIEHHWDGSPYYSLYAHLKRIDVKIGRRVARGEHIAQMGYTGEGLNQERAHVHLELNMMLSRKFEWWYEASPQRTDPNRHGIYNGINLIGLDVARLYLALRHEPKLTIPQFLAGEEAFYRVKVPASKRLDLAEFYPWLVSGDVRRSAREISFNRAGVPLEIVPAADHVTAPTLSFINQSKADYSLLTRNIVGGAGADAILTDSGTGLMQLLTWQ
jgi:murein DD-endopeptidase MepM/ murein hydrolase activator NlpD